ncbi:MAG: TolC family outer membrane protein [Burkholderiales bacterium]|nr:TolC family outer membrane protein [Burkholderiales bacterium]
MNKSLLAVLIGTLFATSAAADDLLQLYREARQKDPALASAKAAWQATQEKIPQAQAGLSPSVSVAGSATYTIPDSTAQPTLSGFTKTTQVNSNIALNATVSASQPLYRRQNSIVLDQARVQVAQSTYVLQSVDQDLAVRLAQAYFDVLLAQDTLTLVGAQKAATGESLAQARRNFEVGTATITDTNEAQARYDQIVAQEIATLNDIEIKRRAIEVIIGRTAPSLKPLAANPRLETPAPDNLDAWSSRAGERNLSILIANASLDLANLEVDRNRAAREPVVDLTGSFGRGEGFGLSTAYPTNSLRQGIIGIQVSMPLFTGGLIESRVREALANQDKARQDLESAKRSAAQSARTSFLNVSNGIAQVKALEQAVVSAEVALSSSKLGMEVGVRTNVDVLNSQQQVFSARRDLASARYAVITNTLRLKAAAGALTDADLEVVNRALQ